ncbi:MAG: exodeoxyribonuclease V subunit gamma [Candidatus Melainabacteria bacterium]|nr:MAG: exodeoxyribonuclease V subunit gamma [Candidatus Melainabacteria bacterium]
MAKAEILIGPYRSGKTKCLVSELMHQTKPALQAGSEVWLIVPSKRYEKFIKSLIVQNMKESGIKVMAGLRIFAFYDMCASILRRSSVSFKLIPESLRATVVGRAMNNLQKRGELQNLEPVSEFKGTYAALLELIDEFQRAGLSPTDVMTRVTDTAFNESRYVELARIYGEYWNELDNLGYIDSRRLAFKCREVLAADTENKLKIDTIAFDGFDRFNKLQMGVFSELAPHADNLKIVFDYDEADAENVQYIWKGANYSDLMESFAQAEKRIFSKDPLLQAPIECFKTVDRAFEMDHVVRLVKDAMVNEEIPGSEILVLVPSMRKYRASLETAFVDASLPYFIDDTVDLKSQPVVQHVIKLLRLHKDNFKRADLLSILRSIYFKSAAYELSSEEIEKLIELSYTKKIVEGANEWLNLAYEAGIKPKLKKLFDDLTPPQGHKTLTEMVAFCEDVLERVFDLEQIKILAELNPQAAWIVDRSLFELRNCLSAFVTEDSILSDVSNSDHIVKYDYAAFDEKLLHAIERANFRRVETSIKPVTICSFDFAPNRLYKKVFIAGLVEGDFPRPKRNKGFVTTEEEKNWERFGIKIESLRSHPSFETGMFHSLLDRAVDKTIVSHPMWDQDGEEKLPSFILASEPEKFQIKELPPLIDGLEKPISVRSRIASLFNSGVREQINHPSLVDTTNELQESISMLLARQEAQSDSRYNGNLQELVQTGAMSVSVPEFFSASRLNDYGKCPFRYWVNHMLSINPIEEPELKLDTRDLGQAYHKVLEVFYQGIIQDNICLNCVEQAQIDSRLSKAIEIGMKWLEDNTNALGQEFWPFQKREMTFRIERFVSKEIERLHKDKDGSTPLKVEASFGMDNVAPLVLSDQKTTVKLRGKIDRIDAIGKNCPEHLPAKSLMRGPLKVIDYKSSSAAISEKEAQYGRNIQLPVYAMACSQVLYPGEKVNTGNYLSITSGKSIGKIEFNKENKNPDDPKLLDLTEDKILSFKKGMSRGNFSVKPNGSDVCKSCDHASICRIPELSAAVSSSEEID